MEVQVIPLIILILYALLTIVVANFVLKKKLGSDHFLVAARALPLTLVTAVLLGDMVGGSSTVGVCQRGYTEGIVASLYAIAVGISFFIFASTMSARFRRLRAVTIPEIIGRLFDARTRLTTALVIAVAYFFIGITQIMAGSALLSPLLGVEVWVGALITSIIFALIITIGGLRSIALVNIIQVVVIFLGLIISLVFSLKLIGGSVTHGISRIWNELPPSFWDYSTGSVLTRFGEGFGTVLTFFAAQAAITGVFAAKDQHAAVKGTWIAGFLLIPIGFGFTLLGMVARIHYGDVSPYGLEMAPALMLELHPFLAGLALCGLFAAILSTGPLNFLAPVQIFVRDVYSVYINPHADDRKLLLLSRVSAIIVVIGGWGLAVTFVEILQITYWAFAFRAGIAIILLCLTYLGTRYVSESGAFWGLIAGVVVFVIWTLSGSPFGLHVSIPSMAACLIFTLIVSKFIPRKKELAPEVQEALHPQEG
jgi:SSS family solute:Na+ symporter